MSCKEGLRTQSWLDGELQGVTANEAERHMETCADCQAQAAENAAISDALRLATQHRVPSVLRARINSALQRETARPRGFWAGAISGAGVTALAAVLALFALLPPSAATLTDFVVEAHGRALTGGTMIAVVSSDHHTVKPWLAAHVAISPPVTDFAAEGFPLAGGRTDTVAGAPAAVIVYRHGKHVIDLFAWPDHGTALPAPGMTHGFRSLFWKSGDLDFAAVSDADAHAFTQFIALARAQRE